VTDPRSGDSISIPAAIDRGFLEVEVIDKKILEQPVTTKPQPLGLDATDSRGPQTGDKRHDDDLLVVSGVFDPALGRQLSLEEAVTKGLVDLNSGVYVNSASGKQYLLSEAIRHGYLSVRLPVAGDETADSKDVIERSTLGGDATTNLEELVEESSRLGGQPLPVDVNYAAYNQLLRSGAIDAHCDAVVDPTTGRTLSIDEALHSGLLVLDPLGIVPPAEAGGPPMPLDKAAALGLVDTRVLRDVLAGLDGMSLERMVESGVLDADSGQYRDPETGKTMSVADAVAAGKLDPYKVFYTDPTTRTIVSLGTQCYMYFCYPLTNYLFSSNKVK